MLPVPNHCLSRACIPNVLITVRIWMSPDCKNKCLSLQHSHSNSWILHHPLPPPTDTWNCNFYVTWYFPGGGCGWQCSLCGWQLYKSILLGTALGGVVCRGMKGSLCLGNEQLSQACTKTCTCTNQECQIAVHLFEGRLYAEAASSFISVLYW